MNAIARSQSFDVTAIATSSSCGAPCMFFRLRSFRGRIKTSLGFRSLEAVPAYPPATIVSGAGADGDDSSYGQAAGDRAICGISRVALARQNTSPSLALSSARRRWLASRSASFLSKQGWQSLSSVNRNRTSVRILSHFQHLSLPNFISVLRRNMKT